MALGRIQLKDSEDGYIINTNQHCNSKSKANVLREAGDIVNDLIHAEITKQSNDQIYVQNDQHELNIDKKISMVDPQLWTFLESVTRTIQERNSSSKEERNAHTKNLRRFYLLCILMYCTNSQKPTMLHVLLANVVEMCGGSRTLIKILNQLGVAASADTHDRFVTCVSEKQREKSIWESLPENTFSIASVNNFDMLQSHAAVYRGDQQRSYHGTNIQLVQPDPSLILRYPMSTLNGDHLCTLCDAVFRPTQCKRKSSHTPSSSPHKLGKVGPKRPRTLVVRD